MADIQRIQRFLSDYRAGGGTFEDAMSFLSGQGLLDDDRQEAPVMQARRELQESGAPVAFTNPVDAPPPITLGQAETGLYQPTNPGPDVGPHYTLGERSALGASSFFTGHAEAAGRAGAEGNQLLYQAPFAGQLAALVKGVFDSAPRDDSPEWRKEIHRLAEESREDYAKFGPGNEELATARGIPDALIPTPQTETAARLMGAVGEFALDPLNALPGIGFADDIAKVGGKIGEAGARYMAKGVLTDAQWGKAIAGGLTDDAVGVADQLGEAISVHAAKQKTLRGAGEQFIELSKATSQEGADAAKVVHKAHGDIFEGKIGRLTAEYNDQLDKLDDLFPQEVIPRPAEPPSRVLTTRPELPTSLTSGGRQRIVEGPGARRTETGLEKTARLETAEELQAQRVLADAGAEHASRPIVETSSRHEKMYLQSQEVLTRGYHRSLAQADLEYRAIQDYIESSTGRKLARLGTGQEWMDAAKLRVARRADEYWKAYQADPAKGRANTLRHAKDAVDRVSRRAAASATAPADETSEMLGQVAREQSRAYIMSDAGVPVAELRRKPGLLERIVERSIGVFRGGEEGAVGEGLLRIAANRYRDPAIRKSVMSFAKMIEKSNGDVAEFTFRAQELRREVSRQVSRYAKENGVSIKEAGESLMLNEARKGNDLSVITDAGVQKAVADAGGFIDELTDRFIKEGLVYGKGADVLRSNMGKYMHTSYAFTHSKNWAEQVQNTQTWDRAFEWMREAYPDMTPVQIEGQMLYMVERQQGVKFGKGVTPFRDLLPHSNIPTQKLDELKHKKDIPPEIRELFGINKDFFVDFDTTAVKMVGDLEATAVQRRILAEGLRNGTIRTTREAAQGTGAGHTVGIKLERISNDREFYVTEETAAALGIFNEKLKESWGIQAMMFFNGLTKFGKIVPSPSTQARNAWSLGPMLMMNGTASSSLVRPMVAKEAARLAAKVWKIKVIRNKSAAKLTKAEEDLVLQAHKHNLFGTGVFTGEQEIWAKQVGDVMTGSKIARTGAFKKGETAMDAMRRSYTSTDDFGKFYSWMVTKEKFAGLYDTANPADLKFLQDTYGTTNLDEAAAEYVKQTFQHFPRTAPIGKKLARFPVAGTFVSFPLEMARNIKNTILISAQEARHFAQTGNPKHLVSSMEKIAGISAVGYLFKGAKDYSSAKFDVDKEAFNDLGLGSWAKGTDYAVTDRKGSKISYADAGFINPYKDINRIIETGLLSEGPISERLFRVAEQVEEVLLGREIFLNAAITALTNQSPEGGLLTGALKPKARRIANPEDPNQLADRAYYFLKQVAPGGGVSAERVATSLGAGRGFGLAPGNKKGRDLNAASEVMGLFGMPRITTVDISENLGYRMWDLQEDFNNIRAARNSNMRMESDPAGRAEVDEIYQEKWSDLEDQYISAVESAKKLGVSRRDINKALDSLHVKKAVKTRIINGVKSDVRFALGPPKLYEEQ